MALQCSVMDLRLNVLFYLRRFIVLLQYPQKKKDQRKSLLELCKFRSLYLELQTE